MKEAAAEAAMETAAANRSDCGGVSAVAEPTITAAAPRRRSSSGCEGGRRHLRRGCGGEGARGESGVGARSARRHIRRERATRARSAREARGRRGRRARTNEKGGATAGGVRADNCFQLFSQRNLGRSPNLTQFVLR